jgi:hypothetical protein
VAGRVVAGNERDPGPAVASRTAQVQPLDRDRLPDKLMVHAFEGNKAETATMLPVINAFKPAHRLTEVTVLADPGMISEANQIVIANSIRVLSRWPMRLRSATVDAGPVTFAVSVDPARVLLMRLSTRV